MNLLLNYLWQSLLFWRLRFLLIVLFVAFGFATLQLTLGLANALKPDVTDNHNQLLVFNGVSTQMLLPLSYRDRIDQVKGVEKTAWAAWVGAFFREPAWTVAAFAVDGPAFFRLSADLRLDPAAEKRWQQERNGAIVDSRFARRYGLAVGDRLPLQSSIWPLKEGGILDLRISGLVTNSDSASFPAVYLHYNYFQDLLVSGQRLVSYFIVQPAADTPAAVVAKSIDALFENQRYLGITQTATKRVHMQQFLARIFDFSKAIAFVNFSVFCLLAVLLVTNMYLIARKNLPDYQLFSLSGFSRGWIARTAFLQQCGYVVPGALLGWAIGVVIVFSGAQWGPLALTGLRLHAADFLTTAAMLLALLLLAGTPAVWQALTGGKKA